MTERQPQSAPSEQGLVPDYPISRLDTTQGFRNHVCGASCDPFSTPESGMQDDMAGFSGFIPQAENSADATLD
jgi:hypothetical protein